MNFFSNRVRNFKGKHSPLGETLLLAQTLKSVKDAVSITDNDDDVIFVNEAFLSTYGYTEKEIIGKKISIIRPLDTSAAMAKVIHESTLKGGWHGEVLNHRKNGEHFTVELWTSIVKDIEGNKVGTVGVARDISDRKKAENELIEAKEKAEEMSRLKSNFLSNMSHELRTPLVGILGFAEILEDEITNEVHKEMINKITQGAGRLSLTLNQILDLSKIETNTSSIEWAVIDLSLVISEVIKIYSIAALKNHLLIKSSFAQPELLIWGDEKMVFSIFNNLINNAVKYSSAGEISINSFVETDESGKFIIVKVADTGIGIPEDKLEIIFEEFRQVSEGLSRGYEGTGLGLTICKKFINLLNGSISVESEQGKGSTFTVRFPLYLEN
jgi:PAS domain S-box-containing protein